MSFEALVVTGHAAPGAVDDDDPAELALDCQDDPGRVFGLSAGLRKDEGRPDDADGLELVVRSEHGLGEVEIVDLWRENCKGDQTLVLPLIRERKDF